MRCEQRGLVAPPKFVPVARRWRAGFGSHGEPIRTIICESVREASVHKGPCELTVAVQNDRSCRWWAKVAAGTVIITRVRRVGISFRVVRTVGVSAESRRAALNRVNIRDLSLKCESRERVDRVAGSIVSSSMALVAVTSMYGSTPMLRPRHATLAALPCVLRQAQAELRGMSSRCRCELVDIHRRGAVTGETDPASRMVDSIAAVSACDVVCRFLHLYLGDRNLRVVRTKPITGIRIFSHSFKQARAKDAILYISTDVYRKVGKRTTSLAMSPSE